MEKSDIYYISPPVPFIQEDNTWSQHGSGALTGLLVWLGHLNHLSSLQSLTQEQVTRALGKRFSSPTSIQHLANISRTLFKIPLDPLSGPDILTASRIRFEIVDQNRPILVRLGSSPVEYVLIIGLDLSPEGEVSAVRVHFPSSQECSTPDQSLPWELFHQRLKDGGYQSLSINPSVFTPSTSSFSSIPITEDVLLSLAVKMKSLSEEIIQILTQPSEKPGS